MQWLSQVQQYCQEYWEKQGEENRWLVTTFLTICASFPVVLVVFSGVYSLLGKRLPEELSLVARLIPSQFFLITAIAIAAFLFYPSLGLRKKLKLENFRFYYPFEAIGLFAVAIPWFLVSNVIFVVLIKYLFGYTIPVSVMDEFIMKCKLSTFIIFALSAVLIAPVVEEFVFRRIIYGVFEQLSGTYCALFITSFIFAMIHFNLRHFPALFILAMLLQGLYIFHRSIYPCILLHCANNLFAVTMLFIARFAMDPKTIEKFSKYLEKLVLLTGLV